MKKVEEMPDNYGRTPVNFKLKLGLKGAMLLGNVGAGTMQSVIYPNNEHST